MQVNKAIITAAGGHQAQLPLQTVVDRTGNVRCAIDLLLDEVHAAGVSEVAVIIQPGASDAFRAATESYANSVSFIEQEEPRGYGDAILRAAEWVGAESFLHLVGDHLYVSRTDRPCAKQLIDVAEREKCAVSAVQPTRENQLVFFGAVGGSPVAQKTGLYEIKSVMEKPTPTIAEQRLIVAGQRAGYYLCLFGMHVLNASVFDLLRQSLVAAAADQSVNLSDALNNLATSQRYLACELKGERYDIGAKYGLLMAQLAIALSGEDRDHILTELVELVAKK